MSSSLTRSLNLNFQKSDSIMYAPYIQIFYLNKLSYEIVEEYNRTGGEGPLIIGEFRQDILTVDFMKATNGGGFSIGRVHDWTFSSRSCIWV